MFDRSRRLPRQGCYGVGTGVQAGGAAEGSTGLDMALDDGMDL